MRIDALTLEGFRNYDRQALTFHDSCNVIYGENAQGKTNLLEAMVYLSCGKSPRARADRELIGFDRDKAYILGQMFTRDREFRTEVELFRGRRRKASVNGVPAKNNAALSDVLHTVFFSPEDLMLIREGAAARRRFMDLSLCQLRPRYGEALAEYHRLYEHKTRILRDSGDYPQLLATLPDFNRRLCQVGAVLIHYRARYCRALAEYAAQAHYECSGQREELELRYQTVSTVHDPFLPQEQLFAALMEHQQSHEQAEIASRLCLSGPHKDDLEVLVNGRSARQFCSQGQVRTAALALKLATAEELEQIKALAFRVNDLLKGIMKGIGIDLVDFKLEFGRLPDGSIVLADEISPDTCRLWDETTHEKLDKDRFRRDLGNVEGAYQEILRRMLGA